MAKKAKNLNLKNSCFFLLKNELGLKQNFFERKLSKMN